MSSILQRSQERYAESISVDVLRERSRHAYGGLALGVDRASAEIKDRGLEPGLSEEGDNCSIVVHQTLERWKGSTQR